MTKKQLRQRVKDLCWGAGMRWLEDDRYFDDNGPVNVSRAMFAVRDALGYSVECWVFTISGVELFGDLDRLVDAIWALDDEANKA